MNLHYSQTAAYALIIDGEFYYLMNLHYSQTTRLYRFVLWWFYYLMNLHYSQTLYVLTRSARWFYYLMNLHYSQTACVRCSGAVAVLLPYEFTLLSNDEDFKKVTIQCFTTL